MWEVEVEARPLEHLASILSPDRVPQMSANAVRARAAFGDRTVWHVNATGRGGGVAEMLQTMLAYGKGAGIDNRWLVLDGDPEFFALTKRIHNHLHGDRGDGGPLGEEEHVAYDRVLRANVAAMVPRVDRRDIVVLHDPQTAGMVDGLRTTGASVVWRCHVGRDTTNDATDDAWAFLRRYLEDADAYVFSRAEYVPVWVDRGRVVVIPPSIDPFSTKNRHLEPDTVIAVLGRAGLLRGVPSDDPVVFERRDGTRGTLRRHTPIADGSPPPHEARIVLQVSRWDRLKDMRGVLESFVMLSAYGHPDVHLMLVGPDVSGVTDDPEGAEVLAECRARWQTVPSPVRERIHLASIPMDDVDENAIIINALQRRADVVVQKSLVEGFGLTVSEAMWKSRAVIASRVGGIQDQIDDSRDGVLLDDPYDLEGLAAAMARLLEDGDLARRLGAAAHQRVRSQFLADRHLGQYVQLFTRLASS